MKIKFSYLPEEAGEVENILVDLRRRYPQAKVKQGDRHPPRLQLYVSVNGVKNCCKSIENTVQYP